MKSFRLKMKHNRIKRGPQKYGPKSIKPRNSHMEKLEIYRGGMFYVDEVNKP